MNDIIGSPVACTFVCVAETIKLRQFMLNIYWGGDDDDGGNIEAALMTAVHLLFNLEQNAEKKTFYI